MPHLRTAEWINLLAFSSYVVLACARPGLDPVRRRKAVAMGAVGLALTLSAAVLLPRYAPALAASVARDWLPALLILVFYWQAGEFITGADREFEARLQSWDLVLVAPALRWCARRRIGPWLLAYLELSYMFCYAAVPFALASLYLLRLGAHADRFWTIVLLSTYPSYGMLPFLQTRPPRALAEKWSEDLPTGRMRAFNLWILRHASIHANTFPSGHVASSLACALALLRIGPLWVALIFLLIAVSIALGAVAGRYHYAADAIVAALLALAVFLAEGISVSP